MEANRTGTLSAPCPACADPDVREPHRLSAPDCRVVWVRSPRTVAEVSDRIDNPGGAVTPDLCPTCGLPRGAYCIAR